MVGLYCPSFMSELDNVGWRFHFIFEDLTCGGHVLHLSIDSAETSLDMASAFALALPDDDTTFQSIDLSRDMEEAIHHAEKATSWIPPRLRMKWRPFRLIRDTTPEQNSRARISNEGMKLFTVSQNVLANNIGR